MDEPITFTCEDGRTLSGKLYRPDGDAKAGVMVASATGIKKEFYAKFSTYLAENGYATLTFDYRGIGESAPADIAKDDTLLQHWGQLDMPAALEALKQQYPDTTYHVIGHSAGGQLIGLMPNYKDVSSFFNFASSSGFLGNMNMAFAVKAAFFLKMFAPASNMLLGYTKSGLVGMGENLPKGVAKQWRDWCSRPGYVKNSFNLTIDTHHYDELSVPSFWLHAFDDPIANLKNVEDMIAVYSAIQAEIKTLEPGDISGKNLGHMNFFRSSNKGLWPLASDWLDSQVPKA